MKRLLSIAILALAVYVPSASGQRDHSARKYLKQGIDHFSKGDLAGAIADYDRALIADPKFAEAYFNRGKARRAQGDLDGAIADYEAAAELDPQLALNNPDITQAYLNRGYITSDRPDRGGAHAYCDRAIR